MADTFAAVFVALYTAHQLADHWVQTEHQAATKGLPGWPGRIQCALHVLSYTLTALAALLMLVVVLHLDLDLYKVNIGLAVSAVTHYIADRRSPLRWLAWLSRHSKFYQLGMPRPGRDDNPSLGTGAYALDQSYHVVWLFVASLIVAS